MTITMTREEVLKRLAERLEMAKAEDVRAAAQHKKNGTAAMVRYKAELRRQLGMDWKTLMKTERAHLNAPHCPRCHAPDIIRKIEAVKLDTHKESYRLTESSELYTAITWLPERLKPKMSVCG